MKSRKLNIHRDMESRERISAAILPVEQVDTTSEIIHEPIKEPEDAQSEVVPEPEADQKGTDVQTQKRRRSAKRNV